MKNTFFTALTTCFKEFNFIRTVASFGFWKCAYLTNRTLLTIRHFPIIHNASLADNCNAKYAAGIRKFPAYTLKIQLRGILTGCSCKWLTCWKCCRGKGVFCRLTWKLAYRKETPVVHSYYIFFDTLTKSQSKMSRLQILSHKVFYGKHRFMMLCSAR